MMQYKVKSYTYFYFIQVMAIPVLEFSREGYKIIKIFAEESTYPDEIIEF